MRKKLPKINTEVFYRYVIIMIINGNGLFTIYDIGTKIWMKEYQRDEDLIRKDLSEATKRKSDTPSSEANIRQQEIQQD